MNRTATLPSRSPSSWRLSRRRSRPQSCRPEQHSRRAARLAAETATDEETLQLQLKLIGPAMEHGTVVAPSGAEPWIRVDLNAEPTRGLGPLLRDFPVAFASDAGYVGVPGEEGTYRWVPLRAKQSAAYVQLVADSVRPFPAQTLAELDPVRVARATTDAAGVTPTEGNGDETGRTALIILLAAAGLLVGGSVVARARRVRHRPAEGEPA